MQRRSLLTSVTLSTVLQSATVEERRAREGFEATLSTSAQARSRLETEMPKWAKLIKERGITAE